MSAWRVLLRLWKISQRKAIGVGGERVASAASGTAKPCSYDATAGNYIVLDHGNGHRTRYLHLRDAPLPADGASVGRGQVIGYEGNTGYTNPAGFYHLHFETRHGATTFTCGYDGTAVDPYASSTYLWTVSPPAYSPIMALDAPAAGAAVTQPFNIGGWAIDTSAPPPPPTDSKIDWVHVYACPSDSAGNIQGFAIFLGAATLGGLRTDVGNNYGHQFDLSGYNLVVARGSLSPRYYLLVVYAHGKSPPPGFNQPRDIRQVVMPAAHDSGGRWLGAGAIGMAKAAQLRAD
jgi:hypothetical protein